MGLDLGLEQEGFEVVVAVENDPNAVATIRKNRPGLAVIARGIEHVSSREILDAAGLKVGGAFVVVGGPCCQSFSTAGARGSLSEPGGKLFRHFLRIVSETRPKFFVMENVKGLLSAAIEHRPLNQRGPGNPPLKRQEELGSAFRTICADIKKLSYYSIFDVLNARDYGVPQSRERVVIIGSREGKALAMPNATHAETADHGLLQWSDVHSAFIGLNEVSHQGLKFSPEVISYLRDIPPGGNWRNLPLEQQKRALGGAFVSWGGRSGFYRRLAWDRPSPALTTSPISKATLLAHPVENRPLSVLEYARIQQFPDSWCFEGPLAKQYRQIGNAVPIGLGAAIGRAVRSSWQKKNGVCPLHVIESLNEELLRKMAARPVTILNPERMLQRGTKKAREEWATKERSNRSVAHYSKRRAEI